MRWLLAMAACLASARAIGLLAVDYGSDSFKASFIGVGRPFDVLYNKDSKRKTASLVSLHEEDRLIGGDALPAATRYPLDAFASVKMTLHPDLLDLYRSLYAVTVIEGNGRSIVLQNAKGKDWSPEELLGMQLSYAKEMASLAAKGDKSFDTVITVRSPFLFYRVEGQ
jgi:hypoxia up-regulated 1